MLIMLNVIKKPVTVFQCHDYSIAYIILKKISRQEYSDKKKLIRLNEITEKTSFASRVTGDRK